MLDIAFPLFFYGVSRSVDDLALPGRHGVRAAPPVHRRGAHGVAGHLALLVALDAVARGPLHVRALPAAQRRAGGAGGRGDPGSRLVRLDDMDHAEAALVGLPGFSNYHPGNITEALVALALES